MAINLVASATATGDSVASISLTVPAGVTTQHLGIIVVSTNASGSTDFTVSGWMQRAEHPAGESGSEFALFTRLGNQAAGNVITIGTATGRVTRATGIWYNTSGGDVAIVGTPWTRNSASGTTTTVSGITTTFANQDVVVVATEQTATDASTITGWTPSAPTQDYFSDFTDADVSHYFGHFTKATAGATGNYTATYTHSSGNAVGVMLGIAAAATGTAPKIATLTQTFSAPLDTVLWESFGSPSVVDGRLAVPADADWDFVRSWTTYDLTASSIFVQMTVATAISVSKFRVSDAINRYAEDNTVQWEVFQTSLRAIVGNAGVATVTELGTYDPAVHGQFFRIRHVSGSTVAFDTSIDATTWTQRTTETATWDLTKTVVSLIAAGFSGGITYFDNVNVVPPAPAVTTVWSSETSSSALSLGWATSNVTTARAVLSVNSSLTSPVYSSVLTPSIYGNLTARFTGLSPGTMYYVGLEVDGVLNANGRGNYRTLNDTVGNSKVIAGSCNNTGSTHEVFTRIKTEAPDFFTHMGDVHYADTGIEATWRTAFKSTLESSTFRSMLQTVPMTYDWNEHDAGGSGSDGDDPWVSFAPNVVRELTGSAIYPDPNGLYRTWAHAGVRYIELDRRTFRDNETVTNSPTKTMLGLTQREWLIDLLQTSSEPAIVIFAGFPHYGDSVTVVGRWSSYPDERTIIGNAIAALPATQKNKIVTISGDSHGVHADSGTNAMWGVPNLCASPLNQAGTGTASGTWNIGNVAVNTGSVLGPKSVDLSTQGTVRTANSVVTIQSQISASSAGDTVQIAAGTYGAVATSKNIGSGFIRIVPAVGATVTIAGVNLTGAQGLDWRGINTTGEVYYDTASRIRWRGGLATPGTTLVGHSVRGNCSDLTVEDATITNALCSFYFYADRDTNASTNMTVQRCRSNNVSQDHVFIGRGTFLTIQDNEFFGHTEDPEHQDGVQIVGGKDVFIRRNHIWNTRAFREAAVDRNDHGFIANYDPAEVGAGGTAGRVPERITIENNLIHDMTSHGITIAGCLGVTIVNNTVYDNGPSGTTQALSVAPDAGNTINGMVVRNNIFNRWTQSGATMTTEANNFVGDASGPAGTNRLTGSPGFIDAANQDYTLTVASQNRATGTATGAPTVDLYQNTRPTPPSRGAIERKPDGYGYFSRLTWTYTAGTTTLAMTWDAVRDDGAVELTWSKSFSTIVGRTGYIKDPAVSGGIRAFIRHRNATPTPNLVDGEGVMPQAYGASYDGGEPVPVKLNDFSFDGGGVSG